MLCLRVLTDYLHLLEDCASAYVPKTPEEELWMIVLWKPATCTVLSNIWQMCWTVGDLEEEGGIGGRADEGGKITFLQEYITRKKRRWRTMAKNRKTPDMNLPVWF